MLAWLEFICGKFLTFYCSCDDSSQVSWIESCAENKSILTYPVTLISSYFWAWNIFVLFLRISRKNSESFSIHFVFSFVSRHEQVKVETNSRTRRRKSLAKWKCEKGRKIQNVFFLFPHLCELVLRWVFKIQLKDFSFIHQNEVEQNYQLWKLILVLICIFFQAARCDSATREFWWILRCLSNKKKEQEIISFDFNFQSSSFSWLVAFSIIPILRVPRSK